MRRNNYLFPRLILFNKQGAVVKAMRKNEGEAVLEVWGFYRVTEENCDEKDG